MATAALSALFKRDWEWEMLDNPEFASQAGEHDTKWEPGTALQHVSQASYHTRAAHSKEMITEVDRILSSAANGELSEQEKIFATLFKSEHEQIVSAMDSCPLFLIPVNSCGTGGICYSFLESIEWMRFASAADFNVLLSRLQECPRQIEEFVQVMRAGIQNGYVASKPVMRTVESTLEALATGNGPFPELADALEKMSSVQGAEALKGSIIDACATCRKAFANLLAFVRSEYNPALRVDAACSSLPCGPAGYAECLRFHTTTSLTADEIHAIGLQEVARIEARYTADVVAPLGFSDFAQFVAQAKVDPRFYATTVDDLVQVYRNLCDEISKVLPSYFHEFPKSVLEIVATTKGPAAYYLAGTSDGLRPGRFYVNVCNLPSHPTYEAVALTLHEAIPGHHHQVSLALENETIPKVLRFMEDRRYEVCPARRQIYSAFVEGWALYCEYLGEELGLYKTPHDLFGRLSMDMMRAVRLVVDTGIHAKGWTVEKAIAYTMEKTGMHFSAVEAEIHRYASWPGQACAYKIGQLEILRLRAKAQQALGAKFVLKDFHSLCLMSGPLTLSLLSSLVDDFIKQRL